MLKPADDYYNEVMDSFLHTDCSMLSFYKNTEPYRPVIYAPDNDAGMRQFISFDPNTQQIIGYFSVQIKMKQAKYIIIVNFNKNNPMLFIQDLITFLNLIFIKYKAETLTF